MAWSYLEPDPWLLQFNGESGPECARRSLGQFEPALGERRVRMFASGRCCTKESQADIRQHTQHAMCRQIPPPAVRTHANILQRADMQKPWNTMPPQPAEPRAQEAVASAPHNANVFGSGCKKQATQTSRYYANCPQRQQHPIPSTQCRHSDGLVCAKLTQSGRKFGNADSCI